ncbi:MULTISPECIES: GNAT family N-acetyltransferase [Arthrobacter]|uniref:GNAT family N-acetyltransferase n=2 Tax=Arthrobacter TaxID=1663 RepID=A0ABU9KI10_9MICC|nr:GNAT family N-acetyltransferase [Arthrobacter sp. YJM1]MDP5225842.1 GNAT family N-acetyltransferase [Arthrobacter sp. YJM1]
MNGGLGGLTVRAPRAEDVPAWAGLIARIGEHEQQSWFEKAEDLEAFLAQHDATDAILAFDDDGVPRAHGRVSALASDAVVPTRGGVDPAWQRKGVGRAVLRWQEARAAGIMAGRGVATVAVRAQHEERILAPGRLFASQGFGIVRWFNEMHRGLSAGLPSEALDPDYELAPWTAESDEEVRLLHNAAFARHWGSEPRSPQSWSFRVGNPEIRRPWCLLVRERSSGAAVAYHLASHDPDIVRLHGRAEGYTELLGVDPAHRGRGLARFLLAEAMRLFTADGMDTAALDMDSGNVTGALALYEGLGYRVVNRAPVWEKTVPVNP